MEANRPRSVCIFKRGLEQNHRWVSEAACVTWLPGYLVMLELIIVTSWLPGYVRVHYHSSIISRERLPSTTGGHIFD